MTDPADASHPSVGVLRAIGRGLSKRCPRCGVERLVEGYYRIRESCPSCGLQFQRAIEDHLGLIYITTAVQTAAFAALVLLVEPARPWIARGFLGAAALGVMLLNLPNRKGFAIAIDYLTGRDDD